MRFKSTLLATIFLLALLQNVSAQRIVAMSRGSSMLTGFQGQTFRYAISADDLKNTPSWNPLNDDTPPLSLKNASKAARDNLGRFVKGDLKNWNVSLINLRELAVDKWYYEVYFACYAPECASRDSYTNGSFCLYVKMDGVIVEPKLITPVIQEKEKQENR